MEKVIVPITEIANKPSAPKTINRAAAKAPALPEAESSLGIKSKEYNAEIITLNKVKNNNI